MDSAIWKCARDSSGKPNPSLSVPSATDYPSWDDWVSPSSARMWAKGHSLLAWFEFIKKKHNWDSLNPTTQSDLSWVDADPSPTRFSQSRHLISQGNKFEDRVIEYIKQKGIPVTTIDPKPNARDESHVQKTVDAMENGDILIYQGVLWEPTEKFNGMPDLLIRSDKIPEIFQKLNDGYSFPLDSQGNPTPVMQFDDLDIGSPNLKGKPSYHYRAIDIKFSSLKLNSQGTNISSKKEYEYQIRLYHSCLENILGCSIPEGYILGRCANWKKTAKGIETKWSTETCFQRLGRVPTSGDKGNQLLAELRELQKWKSDIKSNSITSTGNLGSRMDPLGTNPNLNLRPNANLEDEGWTGSNSHVVAQQKDLTKLPNIGLPARNSLYSLKIKRTDDSKLESTIRSNHDSIKGVGDGTAPLIANCVKVNQSSSLKTYPSSGTTLPLPPIPDLEFFVDFETVSNDNDALELPANGGVFPRRAGIPLIYMIGCGHIDSNGDWIFQTWVTNRLENSEEARIIDAWIAHMDSVSSSVGATTKAVYMWSNAEKTGMEQATVRRGSTYPSIDWYDLEKWVITNQFTVKGGWGTGLKKVVKPLITHYPFDSATGDGIEPWPTGAAQGGTDALMIGTLAHQEVEKGNYSDMNSVPYMSDSVRYNEADCKTMYQFLRHIRKHHA